MKRRHPLKKTIQTVQNELYRKCSDYSKRSEDLITLTHFSNLLDQTSLRVLANDFTEEVNNFITYGMREGIQETLDHLQKQTGYNLETSDRWVLEAQIETQLRKKFMAHTLQERINRSRKVTITQLYQTYRLKLAGLNESFDTVFTGNGLSVYGWNRRLVITEMLRTYHYTVQEFSKYTGALTIEFVFDKAQLTRREEYRELADGGPYEVDKLPDYPRPYASYLLKINY